MLRVWWLRKKLALAKGLPRYWSRAPKTSGGALVFLAKELYLLKLLES